MAMLHDVTHWATEADPERDLLFEREVTFSAERLWRGWSDPELLKRWFCPAPWRVTEAEMDMRPGGLFRTVMEGPDGERVENMGCYLEIQQARRLTWTDALTGGYRPSVKPFVTATLTLEPLPGGGTVYRAVARHADAAARQRHADMGFEAGWGTALDQLLVILDRA